MANPDHLAKLKEGVEAWNAWRFKSPEIEIDLSEAELIEANLRRADLSRVILSGADLSRATLSGAGLSRANLRWANLRWAKLDGADLIKANLSGANLSEANLSGANLRVADLIEAILSEADLSRASLIGADFSRANLSRANLGGANLSGAKLFGADLDRSNLSRAHLTGADLSGADLNNADLSGAKMRGAVLSGTNLFEAKLILACLNRSDLSGARLWGADLCGADLIDANLRGARMIEANLIEASLIRADLSAANLSHAKLSLANLSEANLDSANLQKADLAGTNLTGVRLWETQRAEWSIENIVCEYAYVDKDPKKLTKFSPGEFERIYGEQACIELSYEGGFRPLEFNTLPAFLQYLSSQNPGIPLELKKIDQTGGGARVVIGIGNANRDTAEAMQAVAAEAQRGILSLRDLPSTHPLVVEVNQRLENQRQESLAIIQQLAGAAYEQSKALNSRSEDVTSAHRVAMQAMKLASRPNIIAPNNQGVFAIGDGHTTHQSITHSNADAVALLERILPLLTQLPLTPQEHDQLEIAAHSAQSELEKPAPNPSFVKKSLSLFNKLATEALTKAAGKLAETDAASLQTWLHELAHHAHLLK